MLGRTLAIRSVAGTVVQTQSPSSNAGSQCSMLLAWLTHRRGACVSPSPPQDSTSLDTHLNNFLFKTVQRETPSCSRLHSRPHGHSQTYATSSLPFIATRGLSTLTSTSPGKNEHNRSLPDWSPGGVVVVGGVAMGLKGMSKDKGGFKNLHGRISSLQLKKRMQRKKKKIQEESEEVRLLLFDTQYY